MNKKAIADTIELIAWIFVIILSVAVIILLTTAQQSFAPQKNMLTNAAYANVLPQLIQTKTVSGKTLGELIANNALTASNEINNFLQTTLPEHKYAVYIENEKEQSLTLIAGKPVSTDSVILQGIIAMPDTNAKTIIIQLSTKQSQTEQVS